MAEDVTAASVSFPDTRWSLVISSAGPEAISELCEIYWKPVYGFLRRSGRSAQDSEDLTQSFFASLLADDGISRAKEERGKLRSFLLGALKRHVHSERRSQQAAKRGGGFAHFPLASSEVDFEQAEHQYVSQPVNELTPEKIFERRWVLELLDRAHQRLRHDYQAVGKELEYELLKPSVATVGEVDMPKAARQLKVKEASVRVLIHRLRRNFRAAFRDEIAETVTSRSEVEEEFQRLLSVFS